MVQNLIGGLLGRVLGYAVFGLGFWLLFQGFLRPNIPLGVLGGAMIPGGLYLMARAGRSAASSPAADPFGDNPSGAASGAPSMEDKEDEPGDPLDGSGESHKFSP